MAANYFPLADTAASPPRRWENCIGLTSINGEDTSIGTDPVPAA